MVCFNFWCSSSDKRVPLTTRTPSEYMDFCDSPCRDFTGVAEHLLSPSENHRPLMITDSCTMTCYWPIWGWGRLHYYLQGHGEVSTGVSRRQLDSLYTPESGNRPPPSFQLRLQKNHGINVTFVSLVKRAVRCQDLIIWWTICQLVQLQYFFISWVTPWYYKFHPFPKAAMWDPALQPNPTQIRPFQMKQQSSNTSPES